MSRRGAACCGTERRHRTSEATPPQRPAQVPCTTWAPGRSCMTYLLRKVQAQLGGLTLPHSAGLAEHASCSRPPSEPTSSVHWRTTRLPCRCRDSGQRRGWIRYLRLHTFEGLHCSTGQGKGGGAGSKNGWRPLQAEGVTQDLQYPARSAICLPRMSVVQLSSVFQAGAAWRAATHRRAG